jgi:AcrR family transcriptional regulator
VSATATAPGRPRDPEVDRRITDAALDLFADTGWAGFAMETVARRAGVGKASVFLRFASREQLLTEAVTLRLIPIADVDTGALRSDLVALATQLLRTYGGGRNRAALRLLLEAHAIPGVAEHHEAMRAAHRAAARAVVRRAVARGEAPPGTSPVLLLETLEGAALVHPPEPHPGGHARRLAAFLLTTVGSR